MQVMLKNLPKAVSLQHAFLFFMVTTNKTKIIDDLFNNYTYSCRTFLGNSTKGGFNFLNFSRRIQFFTLQQYCPLSVIIACNRNSSSEERSETSFPSMPFGICSSSLQRLIQPAAAIVKRRLYFQVSLNSVKIMLKPEIIMAATPNFLL